MTLTTFTLRLSVSLQKNSSMWLRVGSALVCKQLSVFILHIRATGAGTESPPWRGRRFVCEGVWEGE